MEEYLGTVCNIEFWIDEIRLVCSFDQSECRDVATFKISFQRNFCCYSLKIKYSSYDKQSLENCYCTRNICWYFYSSVSSSTWLQFQLGVTITDVKRDRIRKLTSVSTTFSCFISINQHKPLGTGPEVKLWQLKFLEMQSVAGKLLELSGSLFRLNIKMWCSSLVIVLGLLPWDLNIVNWWLRMSIFIMWQNS